MLCIPLEKHVSKILRILLWVTSVPHTGSLSIHTQSLHFTQGTGCGLLFCSQDCQKDLSTSHVLLCAFGRPSLSLLGLPWIVHSRSTVRVSPSIILSGLRMFCQISIEFVVRFSIESLKKPSLWSTRVPTLMSNVSQLLSTVVSQFSYLRVMEVPVPGRVWQTFHIWAWPPIYIVTGAPVVISPISGKDCLGVKAILSSMEPGGGWLMVFKIPAAWFR